MEKVVRRAYLVGKKRIELKEEVIREPGPGEVLVRIKASLTCGTDYKTWKRGHPKISFPSPFGHEFSGEIESVGEGVENLKPGDPIMTVHTAPCGECFYCKRNFENLCENLWSNIVLGAYSDAIILPEIIVKKNLFKKPDLLSFEEAAFLEPLSNVLNGLEQIEGLEMEKILVIGLGAIGLLFISVLSKGNRGEIIAAGRRRERLELAEKLGASSIIDVERENIRKAVYHLTNNKGVSIVIECTGSEEVWLESPFLVRKGGTILLFGGLPKGTSVCYSAEKIHYDQITLKGSFHFAPRHVREAYRLLIEERLPVAYLITDRYPLGEIPRVFELLDMKKGIKYAIIPE
jgi:L-iditol 2-dehydrogenase